MPIQRQTCLRPLQARHPSKSPFHSNVRSFIFSVTSYIVECLTDFLNPLGVVYRPVPTGVVGSVFYLFVPLSRVVRVLRQVDKTDLSGNTP